MRTVSIALLMICSSTCFTVAAGEARQTTNRPCTCTDGHCKCCTGFILQQVFSFEPRQRGCVNIAYDPDEFAFKVTMKFNDRVLYQSDFSGKNPRPACVPLPRVPSAKMCVRFSNVYFVGRNVHMCLSLEGKWRSDTAFSYEFNCMRVGADGMAVVSPEEGGGLPQPQGPDVDPQEEDYDVIDEADLLIRILGA